MADTAAGGLRRLLLLLPKLADGKAHRLDPVAKSLGVSRKMLLDDLQALTERLHEPAAFVEGVTLLLDDKGISANTQLFRRPMRLTMAELCALELGLAMLRAERPAAEHAAIDRARERLRALITKLPGGPVPEGVRHATIGAIGDPANLAAARRALELHRKLRIVYHSGSAGAPTTRVIRPFSLAAANGTLYVVAHCEKSDGMRVFRMDRILEAALTDGEFEVPPDFSVVAHLKDGAPFVTEKPPQEMKVRYSPKIARWIAEREELDVASDGSLTVTRPLSDHGWALRHVLQYGAEAEVLEPESVREEIRVALRRVVRER